MSELPAIGNGGITFGSFNNLAKVTPPTVEMWASASMQRRRTGAAGLVKMRFAFAGKETVDRFTAISR